jgi:hypothetical protein
MTKTKQSYSEFIEEQILSGKSNQEIFNEAVTTYDAKIHDIAEVIRKTPSREKRLKYRRLNDFLMLLLIANAVLGIINRTENNTYVAVAPSFFTIFLLYGLYNFKYPAHLFTAILLTVLTTILIVILCLNFDFGVLFQLILTMGLTILAWYINSKIGSDYTLNRNMLKDNPDARIDVITFDE